MITATFLEVGVGEQGAALGWGRVRGNSGTVPDAAFTSSRLGFLVESPRASLSLSFPVCKTGLIITLPFLESSVSILPRWKHFGEQSTPRIRGLPAWVFCFYSCHSFKLPCCWFIRTFKMFYYDKFQKCSEMERPGYRTPVPFSLLQRFLIFHQGDFELI